MLEAFILGEKKVSKIYYVNGFLIWNGKNEVVDWYWIAA